MRDPTTTARGRTRWRRFGLAFVPAMGLVVTVVVLMMAGVLAAPITISGVQFTVKADKLIDHGNAPGEFTQWGDIDPIASATPAAEAVAISDIKSGADLGGLTQTVCGPVGLTSMFGISNIELVITAKDADAVGDLQVHLVGPNALTTGPDMVSTFTNIKIGALVPTQGTGAEFPLTFGQTANSFNITNTHIGSEYLTQTAVYTAETGSFALTGLGLAVSTPAKCP